MKIIIRELLTKKCDPFLRIQLIVLRMTLNVQQNLKIRLTKNIRRKLKSDFQGFQTLFGAGHKRFFYPTERVLLSNFETVEEIQNTSVSLGNHFD